jgi:pullulanase
MFYMANKLGAWQIDGDEYEGRVSFKLFFPERFDPEIASIRVAGSFQHLTPGSMDWDFPNGFPLTRDDSQPEGTFWSYSTLDKLPAGFYEYKYLVQFNGGAERIVSDPCTRYDGTNNQNAAVVVGGSRPEDNVVKPLKSGRKHLHDLIIYEIHPEDFSDEYRGVRAPLDAIIDKLDYLADLGFNAILLMPWTASPYQEYDWCYEPLLYFAVEYRYANNLNQPEEKLSWLKKLISACHDRDIHVIMDGVFNHVSVDFPYKALYRDPTKCPYTGEFGGGFPGLQDLDFDNHCTQEFIRDVCLYWIETFNIDGIRFDNTVNFYVADQEAKGLPKLLDDIQDYLDQQGEMNFSLTLEHLSINAAELTNTTKATSYWDNALYERCFHYLWHGHIDPRFLNALNTKRYLHSRDKVPTTYLTNHDHSDIAWQAGARDNVGAMQWYKTQPYVIALYTATATPLIKHGEDSGHSYWIPENDQGTRRRIAPRPLRWQYVDDKIGTSLCKLYKRMAAIRRTYAVLRTGAFDPDYWED